VARVCCVSDRLSHLNIALAANSSSAEGESRWCDEQLECASAVNLAVPAGRYPPSELGWTLHKKKNGAASSKTSLLVEEPATMRQILWSKRARPPKITRSFIRKKLLRTLVCPPKHQLLCMRVTNTVANIRYAPQEPARHAHCGHETHPREFDIAACALHEVNERGMAQRHRSLRAAEGNR
jgi:hypothetical protein